MSIDKLFGKFNFLKEKSTEKKVNFIKETTPDTEELKIKEQIEKETELLLETTEGLKKDIEEFGDTNELEEALEKNPNIKESFFSKHWALKTILIIQSAGLAGAMIRDQFPGEFWNKLGNTDSGDIKFASVLLTVTALYAFIKYIHETISDRKELTQN